MSDKLDFNEIIRRSGGGEKSKERAFPSELYQCVVFFSRPIRDEFEEIQALDSVTPIILNKGPIELVKNAAKEQRFVFPFHSKEIFTSQQEALNFLPIFIKRLMKEEKLPSFVINADMSVNEDVLKPGVAPLIITMLEGQKDEFKN